MIGVGVDLPSLAVRGGGRSLPWANLPGGNALHAWDFTTDQARWNGVSVGALANTPGWSFARASAGYARTAAGVLVPFSSGELRRTDKGVLIEGARTNLCLRSQEFDNASWLKGNATVSADAIAAPDGTITADKLVETTATGSHRAYQSQAKAASAIAYTFSVFAKAAEREHIRINLANNDETGSASAWFNLTMGVAGNVATSGSFSSASSVIQALGGGWYRCSVTATSDTAVVISGHVRLSPDGAATTYAGDDTKGAYLWGAQLEAASFPSSYIPTTTASATRAADVLTVPVSGIDYPLSLFAEFERAVDTGAAECYFYTSVGSSALNRAGIYVESNDTVRGDCYDGSGATANPNAGAIAVAAPCKAALRIELNNVNIARNGSLGSNDTSAAVPSTPNTIQFGRRPDGVAPAFGYLRRAALYTRALSDAELQAVTA